MKFILNYETIVKFFYKNASWFGTHKQYDLIDAKKISYVKADKK